MDKKLLIGISAGDPAGIGPEVTAKALDRPEIYRHIKPLVVCDASVMEEAVRFSGLNLKIRPVSGPQDGIYEHGMIDVLDMKNVDIGKLEYKKVDAMYGRAAFEYVKKVIELAMAAQIDATVTGPIHKEAINQAGYPYDGHTEIYADLTGTRDYAMMLSDSDFRVVHISTHVSLRQAIDLVKKERILRVIDLTNHALCQLGIRLPRLAVAGLNPHAGDGGLFGREEIEEIAPAVAEAQGQGLLVEGPLPPDTVFSKMRGGQYDAVVVMYHDQGHIPAKLTGFTYDQKTDRWLTMSGVNVTLGLPIVRASVDHGVAFDRAGEGRGNPESMIQAISMAARLARPIEMVDMA